MKEIVDPVVINDVDNNIQAKSQKNMTSFINNENVAIAKKDFDNEMEIGQIKIMLSSLLLKTKVSKVYHWYQGSKKSSPSFNRDIKFDVLADGCKVACVICQQYFEPSTLFSSYRIVIAPLQFSCRIGFLLSLENIFFGMNFVTKRGWNADSESFARRIGWPSTRSKNLMVTHLER